MRPAPIVLAFDTSAAHCAAALLSGGAIVAARREEMGRGQAERLMPLLGEMLDAAGIGWRDLDGIGVGVGPGNFTGIRIAVSAARGLALGLDVSAVGVTGFEALALGLEGPVLAILPAPRDTLYVQTVIDGQAQGTPQQLAPAELPHAFDLPPGTRLVGPGAEALAATLGLPVAPPLAAGIGPAIARIAATRLGQSLPRPAPLYLRPADAAPPSDPPPVILP
ncbi:tRNA (adenosine(37)-N6)-threonylcarbamoyltransferase complex dimerization subunit type 1 TsaB [Rhodovulum marinum]|uniref:tRNA threonylcarbamoyl adenosine modification protein YeaZ n=1 Tax=Rhodovulum marinum TaxID=320662 RepID=A0A4R2PVH3_9RHOB|nr:tRNA (adenosine(37)-N6)-threonylcarbamoyltransferase complex dimerization subunit type 1 TsaB [Rhodovulum marinum]TCP39927.1 tRNA threonylcarbamoyl adenosine modification protein YeaZ [Rhodovulum marinum]